MAPAVLLISTCAFPPLCDTQAARASSDDGDGGGSLLSAYYMPRNDPGISIFHRVGFKPRSKGPHDVPLGLFLLIPWATESA